ncbi:MAG: Kae1-associated serine/threonine protein kinase [Candidatus Marsarchaeota archaeon]|nr:Kae1-associated serine/threonine protein kinase [Candidatus Marsarchaeota archaeon]MCL5111391.1 Kae1-associated serine/threonine protein kinase [Candidatus Marsarchaeota archaeon]
MRLISEGAEARIYETRFLGMDTIVKERAAKRYRIKQLDDKLRRQRTKSEARLLYAASSHGMNVPNPLLVGLTSICMRRIRGRSLHEFTTGFARIGRARLSGALHDAGVYCGLLHNLDIAHGDYTPANLMLDNAGELWIIDFGLAKSTKSPEEKALDLLLMKRSVSQDLFQRFLAGYRKSCAYSGEMIKRLAEIERRGRYQTHTLMAG